MMRIRFLTTLLLVAALGFVLGMIPQTAQAQKASSRISHDLQQLYNESQSSTAAKSAGDTHLTSNFALPVVDGKVLIDAIAANTLAELRGDLSALGLNETGTYGKTASGWLSVEALGDLEDVKSLQFARPSYRSTSVGLVTSQGDASMKTDLVRSNFGLDGTGLTVGILSDTFDDFGGTPITTYADDVANGDLPAGVNIIDDTAGPGIDEGRGMAQLIYDAAPGVDLAFHTAFGGQAGFAQGILDLAVAGSDVIVDDVIYFAEPMFQDGIIAQAADAVAAAGIPYFSSAGNNARQSYESGFRDSGTTLGFNDIPDCGVFGPPPLFGGTPHDFDAGAGVDTFQEFTVNPGEGVGSPIVLQWDEPFFSVSGAPGSASDYDMYLILTDAGNTGLPAPCVLQGSASTNVGGDAVEVMGGISLESAATAPVEVAILITEFDAPSSAGLMKYVSFGGNAPDEYDTKSGTSYGHANAAGAEGVGAAFYGNTPVFSTSPPVIESFSSAGGTPILFETNGTPKASPEVRLKPGITAPDGTNTTFFLGNDVESDGFPNFFGTSAAAPHAAAAAALILQSNPTLTPQQVYDALRSTAIDMDDPFTAGFDTGFDFGTGFGLIDALAAVDATKSSEDCTPTTLVEGAPYVGSDGFGRVDLTFSTPDGITEIDFSLLNNLQLETSTPAFTSESTGADGLPIYTYNPAASPIAMTLKQVDNANDEAGYFGIASSPCLAAEDGELKVEFDPPVDLSMLQPERFALPEAADVTLAVYDVLGRQVATLVDGAQPAGRHEVVFDTERLPSGLYVYRLTAGQKVQTRRLLLVK